MIALLPALSLAFFGCFKPADDLSRFNTETVPFDNVHVQAKDAVVRRLVTELECPDGSPASFYAVYRRNAPAGGPVAITMHSGAFDYVMERSEEGPLAGPHYHANSRLNPEFATAKVWESLGMQIVDLDPAEDNQGTLPATLVDRGFLQIHPGNCWGDLWHNQQGVEGHTNALPTDGFAREGLTMAGWMVRFVTDPDFADDMGIDLPTGYNADELYLIGLGDGGRGVVELMQLGEELPPIRGVLLDSIPDDLSALTRDPETFEDEIEGLSRIFTPEGLDTISESSLLATAADVAWPDNLVYLWSDGDTRLPTDAMQPTARLLNNGAAPTSTSLWVHNTHEMGHVLSNSDIKLAREVVDFLTSGSATGSE